MEKLFNRIIFANDTTPALNEANLNAVTKAIDDIDDRVVSVCNNVAQLNPLVTQATQALTKANSASDKADVINDTLKDIVDDTAESVATALEASQNAERMTRSSSLTATHSKEGNVTTVSIKNASTGVIIDTFTVTEPDAYTKAEIDAKLGDVESLLSAL